MDITTVDPRVKDQYFRAQEVLQDYVAVMGVDPKLVQIWDDCATRDDEGHPIVYMMFNSVMLLISVEDSEILCHISPNLNGNPAMLCYESAVLGRVANAKTTEVMAIDPVDGKLHQGEEDAWENHHEMIRRMALNLVHEMGENITQQKEAEKPDDIIDLG